MHKRVVARVLIQIALTLLIVSCPGRAPIRPRTLPSDAAERRESVAALARALYASLGSGTPENMLIARTELDDLVTPDGRMRAEAWRENGGFEPTRRAWAEAQRVAPYAGYCAQGARDEGVGGGIGLREPAWTVRRVLLVGDDGTRRSAAWVEGVFVWTDRGFRVLGFSRIEAPRAHHADLELAPCDVEQGIR